MNDYSINQVVMVDNKHLGKVVGGGMYQRPDPHLQTNYLTEYLLIQLDTGYYDLKGCYVSVIVAHPDNVRDGRYEKKPV
jgi:hypothetical protein